MSESIPRTRRELREALESEKHAREQAEAMLTSLGYQYGEHHRDWHGIPMYSIGWHLTADAPKTVPLDTHEKIVDQTISETQAGTRRETLSAVIDALQLAGYTNGGFVSGIRAGELVHSTDRFWDEIQTALEVRAERKKAEQRAATEAKVSRIGKQVPRPIVGFDAASGVSVFASIHDDGRVQIDRVVDPDAPVADKPKTTKKNKGDKK